MNVKLDTKERFTVIIPQESHLPANMTAELNNLLLPYLQKDIPHIVFNMENVKSLDGPAGETIARIQGQFYEQQCSFVICNLQPGAAQVFEEKELLDIMNITPSESEAWDIVQMEEIERELLGDED